MNESRPPEGAVLDSAIASVRERVLARMNVPRRKRNRSVLIAGLLALTLGGGGVAVAAVAASGVNPWKVTPSSSIVSLRCYGGDVLGGNEYWYAKFKVVGSENSGVDLDPVGICQSLWYFASHPGTQILPPTMYAPTIHGRAGVELLDAVASNVPSEATGIAGTWLEPYEGLVPPMAVCQPNTGAARVRYVIAAPPHMPVVSDAEWSLLCEKSGSFTYQKLN